MTQKNSSPPQTTNTNPTAKTHKTSAFGQFCSTLIQLSRGNNANASVAMLMALLGFLAFIALCLFALNRQGFSKNTPIETSSALISHDCEKHIDNVNSQDQADFVFEHTATRETMPIIWDIEEGSSVRVKGLTLN